jgi:hypothetical protein
VTKKEKHIASEADVYASVQDFCGLFMKEMDSLYQLAFLLTADSEFAYESVLNALEDCKKAKVFKPWSRSWSRLAVIERALKAKSDALAQNSVRTIRESGSMQSQAILQLSRFERFVYTLSVLEKFSIRDCGILLKVSKREVVQAKVRALQSVSTFIATPFAEQASVAALGA